MKTVVLMTLLLMSLSSLANNALNFPKDFMFGLANAPGHVEDNLNDIWLDFAQNDNGVYAYHNQTRPEDRLKFWSKYKTEIDIAAATGIQIFRLGIDWGRLTYKSINDKCLKKKNCQQKIDMQAVAHYQKIIKYIRSKNLKVMLTLFHHSLPVWAKKYGGFKKKYISKLFVDFSKQVFPHFNPLVDYWITFNEPTVYAMLTHIVGLWPSGFKRPAGGLGILNLGPLKGRAMRVQKNMSIAHNKIYTWMHKQDKQVKISIAKNTAFYTGNTAISKMFSKIARRSFNYFFMSKVINHLDYIGINYYGAEHVKGLGVQIKEDEEYSEAGRAVSPNGFYKVIMDIHEKYNKEKQLPFFITENGVADATDKIRPSYLIEHLAAIRAVMNNGVKVLGYIFWTLTDNWEWADGYCPKFGLVAVDRENGLKRTPRPSYFLFSKIAITKQVSSIERDLAWAMVKSSMGKNRPFCRSMDGVTPLDVPAPRPVVFKDWRFNLQ